MDIARNASRVNAGAVNYGITKAISALPPPTEPVAKAAINQTTNAAKTGGTALMKRIETKKADRKSVV